MTNLKEKLLNTSCFIDNEWLDKYIALIISAIKNKNTEVFECHHIIPFCYFTNKLNIKTWQEKDKLRKLSYKTDTNEYNLITKNNIVYLSYYKHCLAHYYLFYCMYGKFSYYNELAFNKMTNRKVKLDKCSEQEVLELIQYKVDLLNNPESKTYKSNQVTKIILENYPKGGYKLCQKLIKEQLNLNFTKTGIKARAFRFNVKGKNYRPSWTENEINILKEYYPKYGYKKCLELLPNKNKYTIQSKAESLNLLAPGASKLNAGWTIEEDEILEKYYPLGGAVLCKKYLVNRSLKAIKSRANIRLKIYKDSDKAMKGFEKGIAKHVYLLDENNNILKEFNSIKETAKYLNYSATYISSILNHKCFTNKFKICFRREYK